MMKTYDEYLKENTGWRPGPFPDADARKTEPPLLSGTLDYFFKLYKELGPNGAGGSGNAQPKIPVREAIRSVIPALTDYFSSTYLEEWKIYDRGNQQR